MSTQAYPNVIFDIGVVLLHLQYDQAIRDAVALCDPARRHKGENFLSLLGRTHLVDEYERGLMSAEDFFGHFVRETGFHGTFGQFTEIWRSIFAENTPMIDLAHELAGSRTLFLMTNASDLHVPWVFTRYPRLNFFRDCACSCYIGESKPSPAFYRKGLAKFGVEAAACLFIDDRPENVEAAEKEGIRSVLYTDAPGTILRVKRMLNLLDTCRP